MKQPLAGRADLVRALSIGLDVQDHVARHLGFDWQPRERESRPQPQSAESESPERTPSETVTAPQTLRHVPVPFWHAVQFEVRQVAQPTPPRVPDLDEPVEAEAQPPVPVVVHSFQPLAPYSELVTRLRRQAELQRPGPRLDVDRLVRDLSRCREVHRLPRIKQRTWGHEFHLVVDLARRLTPYQDDQVLIARRLRPWLCRSAATISNLRDGHSTPIIQWPDEYRGQMLRVGGEATVLALADLGALDEAEESVARATWLQLGHAWREKRCRLLALVPCRPDALPAELARLWTALAWERSNAMGSKPTPAETRAALARLLGLVARGARIEPQLLRAVRRLFDTGRYDAGLESRVWQEAARGVTDHPTAASFSAEQANRFAASAGNDPLRKQAFQLAQHFHRDVYSGVRFLEVVNLGVDESDLANPRQHREAHRWLAQLWDDLQQSGAERDDRADFLAWSGQQISRDAFATFPFLHAMWSRLCPEETPPEGYDPALADSDKPVRTVAIEHAAGGFSFKTEQPAASKGATPLASPIAWLRYREPLVEIRPWAEDADLATLAGDRDAFWQTGFAPPWATYWGHDQYGPWVEFQVGSAAHGTPVTQRIRWIPPGRFLMGSPDTEQGRWSDEGPRHEERIDEGFWMFDTPVTQELWQAVMGGNPSHFKGPRRPVEKVSWVQSQQFVSRLNEQIPGLEIGLPTEAQWEYACRAGTETPIWNSPTQIEEEGHGEKLDQIAWYSPNSGGETHDVAQKDANPWGLYDMLGNVLEWCQDEWRNRYDGPSASAYRVFRGGSWYDAARYVRAAYRYLYEPSNRGRYLGFRCSSSGREPGNRPAEPGGGRSERAVRGRSPGGAGGDSEPASGDRWVNLAASNHPTKPVPWGPAIHLQSDLEQLVLRRLTRPRWANDIGRDCYGLWADFTVESVKQRLRWIPPGRFMMGSPDGEQGRWDREGPQHLVTISRGFWLFDTPCTQALWEVVMGNNPSRFPSPDRPVERVSWEDCQAFCQRFAERLPELRLTLPTEAEWEYACRAGTRQATYAGDLVIHGENNAPVLDRIAWYGGNCGVAFDLAEGEATSRWEEKQYDFPKGGTRRVAQKEPNPWGLHDMLGNVWEWCRDGWRDYADQPERDPVGLVEASSGRVIRGGGWSSTAQSVRAASRYGHGQSVRVHYLGFRCSSSGREPGEAEGGTGAERSEP